MKSMYDELVNSNIQFAMFDEVLSEKLGYNKEYAVIENGMRGYSLFEMAELFAPSTHLNRKNFFVPDGKYIGNCDVTFVKYYHDDANTIPMVCFVFVDTTQSSKLSKSICLEFGDETSLCRHNMLVFTDAFRYWVSKSNEDFKIFVITDGNSYYIVKAEDEDQSSLEYVTGFSRRWCYTSEYEKEFNRVKSLISFSKLDKNIRGIKKNFLSAKENLYTSWYESGALLSVSDILMLYNNVKAFNEEWKGKFAEFNMPYNNYALSELSFVFSGLSKVHISFMGRTKVLTDNTFSLISLGKGLITFMSEVFQCDFVNDILQKGRFNRVVEKAVKGSKKESNPRYLLCNGFYIYNSACLTDYYDLISFLEKEVSGFKVSFEMEKYSKPSISHEVFNHESPKFKNVAVNTVNSSGKKRRRLEYYTGFKTKLIPLTDKKSTKFGAVELSNGDDFMFKGSSLRDLIIKLLSMCRSEKDIFEITRKANMHKTFRVARKGTLDDIKLQTFVESKANRCKSPIVSFKLGDFEYRCWSQISGSYCFKLFDIIHDILFDSNSSFIIREVCN